MRPRYSIARLTMELATGAGVLLIIVAIMGTIIHHEINGSTFVDYLVAGVMVINGIAIIAAAQMGNALLDTAIATREMADNIGMFIKTVKRTDNAIEPVGDRSKAIRAQR